jgi:hypothetical protein
VSRKCCGVGPSLETFVAVDLRCDRLDSRYLYREVEVYVLNVSCIIVHQWFV